MDESLQRAAGWLRGARSVAVLTGAGVSAESGIDTFRDPQGGLWAKYDPMELAHIDAFHRDPELVTRWYHWRFCKCVDCGPNPGHDALARIEHELTGRGGSFLLATQNVDGLHQRAGSQAVVELHGTILTWRSLDTGEHWPIDRIDFSTFPPRSATGALLRPNVVWFGEMLPEDALRQALQAAASCDLLLTVGTSAAVYPAAGLIDVAADAGARVIEINRQRTQASSRADVSLLGPSGQILPALLAESLGSSE